MADLLNKYFASVFTMEDVSGLQEENFELRNLASLNSCNLFENVIIKTEKKKKKKKKKTPGPAWIAPRPKRSETANIQDTFDNV